MRGLTTGSLAQTSNSEELKASIEKSLNSDVEGRMRFAIANIVTALDKLHDQQGDG